MSDMIETLHEKLGKIEVISHSDQDEDTPSAETFHRAHEVLKALQSLVTELSLNDGHISSFDGSIRIVWERSPKLLKLVFSKSASRPTYMYFECQSDYNVIDNPTADAITARLQWAVYSKPPSEEGK